jgi:hypothetical protein
MLFVRGGTKAQLGLWDFGGLVRIHQIRSINLTIVQ